jgi:hypothetical protein
MSRVFISYRRADSVQAATKLYRHLSMRFGKDLIFQDVDDIKLGADFLETIRRELKLCQVYLILIGPKWLIDSQGLHRLDDPNDVLRMEGCHYRVIERVDACATVTPNPVCRGGWEGGRVARLCGLIGITVYATKKGSCDSTHTNRWSHPSLLMKRSIAFVLKHKEKCHPGLFAFLQDLPTVIKVHYT